MIAVMPRFDRRDGDVRSRNVTNCLPLTPSSAQSFERDAEVQAAVQGELSRGKDQLIASEYRQPCRAWAWMRDDDKYAEGYPGRRTTVVANSSISQNN